MAGTPRTMELDVSMAGLVVRPGDTLILLCKDRSTQADVAWLREELEARLPGLKVAVLEGIDQIAAYRPVPPLNDAEAAEVKERWVAEHGGGTSEVT